MTPGGARLLPAGLLLAAACTADGARPVRMLAVPDSADQVMEGFVHVITENGVRKARLEADTAYLYERSQTLSLRGFKAVFYDQKGGERTQLTARRGTYRWQTGAWQADSNVALRSPGQVLRAETLTYDEAQRVIATDRPFVFDKGGEHIVGTSFRADLDFANVVTRKPRGTMGDAFALPGQQ
ncbi:MAG: LPS export ABC transporter periplasmic protein LptC [Gemmatimonadales bacterium]|nr:LPS export ABC transporter periplasmic protein LptC [Gemmatimonadales bacterium]